MVDNGVISPKSAISQFQDETLPSGEKVKTVSVGAYHMLASDSGVHHYGCRVAAFVNKSKEAKKGAALLRPGDTEHYRGSYWLSVDEITKIPCTTFALSVEYDPKPGRSEHCNIVMRTIGNPTKPEKAIGRTQLLAGVWAALERPRAHLCSCDADIAHLLGDAKMLVE